MRGAVSDGRPYRDTGRFSGDLDFYHGLRSNEGAAKLDRVAGSVKEITEGATAVVPLIDQVSRATAEQAQSMEQISRALESIDAVSASTAGNAQHAMEASGTLNRQVSSVTRIARRLRAMLESQAGVAQAN